MSAYRLAARSLALACLVLSALAMGCNQPPAGVAAPAAPPPPDAPEAAEAIAAVREIKASGAPCSAEQWERFYRLPEGLPDRTEAVLDALSKAPNMISLREEFGLTRFIGFSMPLDAVPPPGEEWDELEDVQTLVSRHATVVSQLRAALRAPCSVRFPADPAAFPRMVAQRHFEFSAATRLLRADLAAKSLENDWQLALADLLAMIHLNEAWLQSPDVEQFGLATTEWEMLTQSVGWYLSHSKASPEDLQNLAAELERVDLNELAPRALVGTRGLVLGIFERGDAEAAAYQNSMFLRQELPALPNGYSWVRTRSREVLEVLALYTKAIDAARQGFPQSLEVFDEIMSQRKEFESRPVSERNNLQVLFGSLEAETALRWHQEIAVFQRTCAVAAAVSRYRLREGELPEQLADLVPDFLAAVPLDPYVLDQPVCYRQDGINFVVYSCYSNRTDDKGKIRGRPAIDLGILVRGPKKRDSPEQP